VQVGPNGYYKQDALKNFRAAPFDIFKIDFSIDGGWWAAGEYSVMNYAGTTTHTFDFPIVDITSYHDRFTAVVLSNGDFYVVGPNGYLSKQSLRPLRSEDFEVKMLDYSSTGGWWAAGDYSILNYTNNTEHTFNQRIVDIASYNDRFLVATLEDGNLWLGGPNGYESSKSFSKFQGLDFDLTEVDFSPQGSWWAAGENKIINYGSGTSKVFEERIIDITSFNKDYAVVILDDTPLVPDSPMDSINNTHNSGATAVNEPTVPLIFTLAMTFLLISTRNLKFNLNT